MNKTSEYRGVYKDKRSSKWLSSICWHSKQQFIGSYETETHAALAYDMIARDVRGMSAKLNFPEVTDYKSKGIEVPKIRRHLFKAKTTESKPASSTVDIAKRSTGKPTTPCTVLKYCPYGALVKQFELANPDDDRRCLIYGHICPIHVIKVESANHHMESAA